MRICEKEPGSPLIRNEVMTKGGKKRKAAVRSESQDSSSKYIPQFTKKRKLNNDSEAPSEENPEGILNNPDITQPVEEKNGVKVNYAY